MVTVVLALGCGLRCDYHCTHIISECSWQCFVIECGNDIAILALGCGLRCDVHDLYIESAEMI